MRVAFAGKGGVGKTTLTAAMARVLAEEGRGVIAFDFDVNPGLAVSLGDLDRVPVLPDEAVVEDQRAQYGFRLRPGLSPEDAVDRFAARGPGGIRVLGFGVIDSAYHSLARTHMAVREVAAGFERPGWDVLVDLEAGTKDVYDGTYVAFVDLLVPVTDGSPAADLACRRLVSIADAQGAPPVALVLNRATPERTEAARSLADTLSVAFAGAIPEDDGVRRADLAGSPVAAYDRRGPALRAVERLAGRLRLMAEGARR